MLLPCTHCLSRGHGDGLKAWRGLRNQQEALLLHNGHRSLWEGVFHVGKTEGVGFGCGDGWGGGTGDKHHPTQTFADLRSC